MGLKRFIKKIRRRIKKIIPKEIRPAVPFIAAAINPAMFGANMAAFSANNPLMYKALIAAGTKAATDDEAKLKDIARTGILAAAPDAISGGLTKGGDALIAKGLPQMTDKGSALIKAGQALKGGARSVKGLGALKTVGAQTAVDQAVKLKEINDAEIEKYERELAEQGIFDKKARRDAIFKIYTGAGYSNEYVDSVLDKYGYAEGGVVSLKRLFENIEENPEMIAMSMKGGMDKYFKMLEELARKNKEKRKEKAYGGRVGYFLGGKTDKIDPRAASFVATMTDQFVANGMSYEEARDAALNIAREEFPDDQSEDIQDYVDMGAKGFQQAFGVESLLGPNIQEPKRIIPGFADGGMTKEDINEAIEDLLGQQEQQKKATPGEDFRRQFEDFMRERQNMQRQRDMQRNMEDFIRMLESQQPIEVAEGGVINTEKAMEMDMRGGGFIPVGSKEKADDVPARLSKNEFVMTADAVRGAGGGSVNQGAKRMYDMMNKFEAMA